MSGVVSTTRSDGAEVRLTSKSPMVGGERVELPTSSV
jgi:hypothetical protein